MPFVFGDRCKEISTTTGTGTMTLGGPTAAFQSFAAAVGVANETYYGIVHVLDNSWELGRGTVGAGTLTRDTVLASSNTNLLVPFAAGDKLVFTTNPADFYANALDATSHAAIDHTLAPLNLLDASAGSHGAVDHTAAPLNLLNATSHNAVDHTSTGPLATPLLSDADHDAIDHEIAPFNLISGGVGSHGAIDHTGAAMVTPLMSIAAHNALDHGAIPATNVGEDNPGQVSNGERIAGTEVALRSYSPLDVATMAGLHGGGGGSGKHLQTIYALPVSTVVVCNAILPLDDTIPQISEGTFVMSATITPASIGNTLVFRFSGWGTQSSIGGAARTMLFQGAGPGALQVNAVNAVVGAEHQVILDYYVNPPSSGAPITYSIYIGVLGGSLNLNGNAAGARLWGGASSATFSITEIAP